MPIRGQIKLLTKDELEYLNNRFFVEMKNNMLFISKRGYNRVVCHKITSNFSINTARRKLTITVQAMDYFVKFDQKYSIFDIQNAINTLIILLQDVNPESVREILDRSNVNIKIV